MSMHMVNVEEILLRVPMCCNKCVEKVREELLDMEGVYGFTCDQQNQTVSVIGSVDPFQVLKKMKRIKRKSELWNQDRRSNLDAHYVHREEPVYRLSHSQRPVFNEPFRSTSYETPYYVHREEPVYRLSHSQRPVFNEPFRSTSYETPYRNSYIDSTSTCSSSPYPSPPFRLPYSSSFEHERVLPYDQTYYAEDYPSWRY